MEGARNPIGKPDLDALLRLYHADKETAVALEEMRREGKQRGWWSTYKLPAWLGDLVGLEADAVTERVVELELIPALLQTEEYARAVHVAAPRMPPGAEVERRVAARMQRQKRLTGPNALTLSAVVSSAPPVPGGGLWIHCAAIVLPQTSRTVTSGTWRRRPDYQGQLE
jgi:hypothetical protein